MFDLCMPGGGVGGAGRVVWHVGSVWLKDLTCGWVIEAGEGRGCMEGREREVRGHYT